MWARILARANVFQKRSRALRDRTRGWPLKGAGRVCCEALSMIGCLPKCHSVAETIAALSPGVNRLHDLAWIGQGLVSAASSLPVR
jgi:hypothetical protein